LVCIISESFTQSSAIVFLVQHGGKSGAISSVFPDEHFFKYPNQPTGTKDK